MTVTTTVNSNTQNFLTQLAPNLQKIAAAAEITLKNSGSGVKVTLENGWAIVQTALAQTVLLVEQNIGNQLAGPDKKALVLNFIQGVISTVFKNVTVPYVPAWLTTQVEGYVEAFILEVAAGSIDSLVSTFQTTGVFAATQTVPVASVSGVSPVISGSTISPSVNLNVGTSGVTSSVVSH